MYDLTHSEALQEYYLLHIAREGFRQVFFNGDGQNPQKE